MHVHPAAQRPLCSTLLGAKSARIVCVPKRNPSFPGMLMRPLPVADLEAEDWGARPPFLPPLPSLSLLPPPFFLLPFNYGWKL